MIDKSNNYDSILIKNIILNNNITDVLIEGNLISKISNNIIVQADKILDGNKNIISPGFINGHTHAAMTLFRAYADDMHLHDWLKNKIWPLESRLSENDVYWGTKLACLEMIKSGTTCFNDMYWHLNGSIKAVDEMGLRAFLGAVFIDIGDKNQIQTQKNLILKQIEESKYFSSRINLSLAPHAIYTVGTESLKWIKNIAIEHNLLIHIHVSETEKEVEDCIKKHGVRPFEYLNKIGILSSNLIAAHSIWLSENEIDLIAKNNVKVVYNPISNLKLASGHNFEYSKLKDNGIKPVIGTDGVASNNNLDILESLKFASLIQKSFTKDPTTLPAKETLELATLNGALAFGLNAGQIKEGMLADIVLIDTKRPELTPNHNYFANLVYSANSSCIDTTICNGKILMQNREVLGEDIILEKSSQIANKLISYSFHL